MQQFRPSSFQILPLIVKNLLIINGLMFLATMAFERMGLDLYHLLGLHYFTSQYFLPHQFITHMFMHGSFGHIFSNMLALWMFGSVLENVWGPKRFLIFYLLCGLGGAAGHLIVTAINYHHIVESIAVYKQYPGISDFNTLYQKYGYMLDERESYVIELGNFINRWNMSPNDPSLISESVNFTSVFTKALADIDTVGASGAVFGILIAFGLLFPNTFVYFYFLIPIKAKYFVAFYALFELYSGFSGAKDGVAHFAHIGGAVVGFLLVKFWNKNRRLDFF